MAESQLLIPQCLIAKLYLSLMLICFFFLGCTNTKKLSNNEWKVNYGHFQGMDYLNCKKIILGKPIYEYTFEASNPRIKHRVILLKSVIGNGYVFYWHGVNDTMNILLPKIVLPLRHQSYDPYEKESLKKILLQTNLPLLKERQGFFDSVRYFILIDSIRFSSKDM